MENFTWRVYSGHSRLEAASRKIPLRLANDGMPHPNRFVSTNFYYICVGSMAGSGPYGASNQGPIAQKKGTPGEEVGSPRAGQASEIAVKKKVQGRSIRGRGAPRQSPLSVVNGGRGEDLKDPRTDDRTTLAVEMKVRYWVNALSRLGLQQLQTALRSSQGSARLNLGANLLAAGVK